MPFKVIKLTDVGNNRKLVLDFPCANKLTSYLASFPRYGGLLVQFSLSTGGASLQRTFFGVIPLMQDCESNHISIF